MVALRVVQPGKGAKRALVVVYHLTSEIDAALRAAVGGTPAVLNHTAPVEDGKATTGGAYFRVGQKGLRPMGELLELALQKTGAQVLSPVLLCGFSEGAQAPRAHLTAGEDAHGIVAVDGIHGTWPTPEPFQVDPWRNYFSRAKAGERVWVATCSQIPTASDAPAKTPVRLMLEKITGWGLGVGSKVEPFALGQSQARVYSYAGKDAAAHVYQAKTVLPSAVREALERLGVSLEPGTGPGGGGLPEPDPVSEPPKTSSLEQGFLERAGVVMVLTGLVAAGRETYSWVKG